MIVACRTCPNMPRDVLDKVDADVRRALSSIRIEGARFVVNDTAWYGRGGKPVVMNQAEFISRRFQATLRDERAWSIEEEIEGERIDAYTLAATTGTVAVVPPGSLKRLFERLVDTVGPADIDRTFSAVYQKFVRRSLFGAEGIPAACAELAVPTQIHNHEVKIGLEFETGNIASSSRALAKLDVLYRLGAIDAGVFVACTDKANAAARIWPASNRNGSLEELDAHNYWSNLIVPLWIYGFQPDEFLRDAPYLRRDGTLYTVRPTGRTAMINGRAHLAHVRFGKERVYRPMPEP